ncbi:HAMP domain-containing protein [Sorangium sp. So ce1024]|uniref:HAMP domain-containing protein n=1 Tax=Sorangium sp. So ce1024 TaxID=3133327 RepID=UPI003EFE9E30
MEQRSDLDKAARKTRAGNGKSKKGASGDGLHGAARAKKAPAAGVARAARPIDRSGLDRRTLLLSLTALKKGDFSARLPIDLEGLDGKIADTFNDVVELNERMAKELHRLSRAVGKEGKLSQRASIGAVSGAWAEEIACINELISDLVHPTAETARVIGAVAQGDLSQRMALEVDGRRLDGEFLRTATTVNTMVDQLRSFASEVTRVAREVGTEGKLGGQAEVKGVAGTWKDVTDSVNSMAGNLTAQVRNIAAVTTAVATGDLSKKITVDVKGEILELKDTINTMVDQLRSFASEVTRVAREVGTEGKLGGQAEVKGVAGTWKDLTDSVNSMAGNLTAQVRNIAAVTTAVANGDLSKKITVDVKGEILELKNTINTMVDQLNSFASEVTRVAREVGTEGKLGGQADVRGVAGTWKDLTDSVNAMASNLTAQVRNIATVTTAVAKGDLSKKITVDVKGEILELKDTINTMVDQLSSLAAEVTRVAREVGTEGKLGGQADVHGVAGTWKDLTDSVNSMAGNLTAQVRNIATVTTAVANGDLSKKITVDVKGEILELKNTINTMVDQLRSFASEVTRVAREVGTEGKLGGQADVRGVAGTWKDLTDSVNSMAGNLTAQVRNIAAVTTAVANGDLSKKITVDVKGEILELKNTINTMVDQLNSFASEVTRVAREVGTEGKLGGQADVRGVAGTWKDLTDNVNSMAGNLTNQVRGIAKVVTAVANGDLKRKLVVDAKGEIAALADTINGMIETLATFADQVTTVAREVGVEGKLGGQASVPGAAGTWKDLTDNVNRLAANLTTQVRAIAEVATAVTKGDLTRSIKVEAQGEVAALKDNINEMIRNLKDTTLKNSEQDWLKTNLAKFSRMLQGQKDLLTVGRLILSELAPVVSAQQGVFYIMDSSRDEPVLKLLASYAFKERKHVDNQFKLGEGLVGQCALEKEKILLVNAPPDYITITSGLGGAPPVNIIVMPVLFEGHVKAVIELASLERFSPTHQAFLDQLTESIGIVLNTIEANMRTEDLLKQSQSLARELQSQQEELQETNAALGEKARLLAEQNVEVERKNHEVEQARQALEEKARQLALTSKYKSEFMANMSHELRTPLNSLLILSDQLSRNNDQNLTPRQVEFAKTIHASGTDLLALINDILDLSKIESGTVVVDVGEIGFKDLSDYVQRTFGHVAESKKLEFEVAFSPDLPPSMLTDAKRLQQVLKNLLSNAFKFTERGRVILEVTVAREGWSRENDVLSRADTVIALSVHDTGIGIAPDKQQIIFEAFQQADGSTSRKYGGTGLGLAISREIARLLGGDLVLVSAPGRGSTFTLYLPRTYRPVRAARRQPTHVLDAPAVHEEPVHSSRPSDRMSAAAADLQIIDDSESVRPGDRAILIVENDTVFARFLVDVAREHGFKAVVAVRGATALSLVRELRPSAITLDINLPDIDGWRVLDCLKRDLQARHIPVQVITTETEEERTRARRMGAIGLLNKPLSSRTALDDAFKRLDALVGSPRRRLLLVEPDRAAGDPVAELLQDEGVAISVVETGKAALAALDREGFDALVLGLRLPDMSGLELLDHLDRAGRFAELTAIVYTPADIAGDDELQIARLAQRLPVKHVQSRERLYDEVTLALHRRTSDLPEPKRHLVEQLHESAAALSGKCALIVDDDFRNIYALKTVLESHGMTTLAADTGKAAIERLERTSGIDVVLMDIMMPEMDGYDTMRAIRKRPVFQTLPIIAVTARAMKGDREKCLEAGATDYISKPVDTDQLLALLRIWLHR